MLMGEPGIGKTALCEQLAAHARRRGARVVVGHCYSAESPVPYRAFAEAIGNIAANLDPSTLRAKAGNSAFAVARLLPELAVVLDAPAAEPDDVSGQENHDRLLRGVTAFFHRMARTTPMLLVLEDLHDADHATLDLLVHLSRNLTDSRLCVVGTYRDTEVRRTHPLSAALAELRRAATFDRIPIRGLEPEEISELLDQCGIADREGELARKVHAQTEGNALFVNEVVGDLERQTSGSAPTLPVQVPEGLRDVLGQHLSRLSHATNGVLRVAAVIGREFRLDVLSAASQVPDDELVACLEEACAAALVVEQGMLLSTVGYTFRHALIRQVLYEELSAPRRIRWHNRVATVLEQVHRGRLEDHASELAEHYACSGTVPELAKAVSYHDLAATRAARVYAYHDAAHHLECAIEIHASLEGRDSARHCDLLLGLAEVLVFAGVARRAAEEVAPAAFELALELLDRHRTFRACSVALDALQALGGASAETLANWLLWAERADSYAEPDTHERIRADVVLAAARSVRGRRDEALYLWSRALTQSRLQNDDVGRFEAGYRLLQWPVPDRWLDRVELARELATTSRGGVSLRLAGNALHWSATAFLAEGDRRRFEEVRDVAREAHARGYHVGSQVMGPGRDSVLCLLEGRLDEAIALCELALDRTADGGPRVLGLLQAMFHLRLPLMYSGNIERYPEVVRAYQAAAGTPRVESALLLAIGLSWSGRVREALATTEATGIDTLEDRPLLELVLRLELALCTGDAATASELAERLAPVAHLTTIDGCTPSVARLIGGSRQLQGDFDGARAHYQLALVGAQRIGYRPEVALTQLELAELLLDQYPDERQVARTHLDAAASEFNAMQMQSPLARANALLNVDRDGVPEESTAGGLTRRERDVAGLIAAGRSNREIASELVISEGTVEVHVKHILSKLGFRSRSQVAVWGQSAACIWRTPVRRVSEHLRLPQKPRPCSP
jgi:DNA-binding CsgD family transcriptional regulator/tetratricopeptide (TPR) repeat protein